MTFVKGHSGNPAGRPPGSLNRKTLIVEGLLEDDAETLTRKAIEMAHAGHPGALRLCVDRLLPRVKDRPAPFNLPTIETAADAKAAAQAVQAGVCSGELTPKEGLDYMRLIERVTRLVLMAATEQAPRADEVSPAPPTVPEENTSEEQGAVGAVATNTSEQQLTRAEFRETPGEAAGNTRQEQATGPSRHDDPPAAWRENTSKIQAPPERRAA
jgi:hypothetical protein